MSPDAARTLPAPPTLGELLFLPLNELARLHVGFINLLCATGLPDTAGLDVRACLNTLQDWSNLVRRETERQMDRFRRDPADFNRSEAYFRVLVMVTVLQRDLGVRYNPDSINTREFNDSREGFIHGLLRPGKRVGTCANMPVLYAAIGRKLGYPIYLVHASGHLFCRWHNAYTGERFNIEASGKGLNVFPDEHYMKWPHPIHPADVRSGLFLRNLNPFEEVATFMATRGHCQQDQGCLVDAVVSYAHAHRLDPTDPHYMNWLMEAINEEIGARNTGKMPGTCREAESRELFSIPGVLPTTRFVLNEDFVRIGGVNLDDSKPGRMAPAE